ncbi:phosphatase PAP2 family protein [Serinibacter salmoneus]|nr:phosphatase PAP2 family protein [Serinibacter salmoneus]
MSQRSLTWIGTLAVLLGVGLGFLIEMVDGAGAPPIDVAAAQLASGVRDAAGWATPPARALNVVGGGIVGVAVVPLAVTLALAARRRWWAAATFLLASAASALVVQALKWLFDRDRPLDMLVTSDAGSFPSGHTANAATLAMLAWLAWRRWWVATIGVAWVLAMAASRLVLSVHWFTDVVAGALIGAGVAALVVAAMTALRRRSPAKRGT